LQRKSLKPRFSNFSCIDTAGELAIDNSSDSDSGGDDIVVDKKKVRNTMRMSAFYQHNKNDLEL
jgi:hypothetical protein